MARTEVFAALLGFMFMKVLTASVYRWEARMPYVNKNNEWNSRYACALIRITSIPASADGFCRDDNIPPF